MAAAGWIGYSFVVKDTYVYVPNEIGFLLGLFYTLSCYGLVDSKARRGMRAGAAAAAGAHVWAAAGAAEGEKRGGRGGCMLPREQGRRWVRVPAAGGEPRIGRQSAAHEQASARPPLAGRRRGTGSWRSRCCLGGC